MQKLGCYIKISINSRELQQLRESIWGGLSPYCYSHISFAHTWCAAYLLIFISCFLRNSHQPSPLISLPLPLFCARYFAYDSLISVQWSGERTERNGRAGLMACTRARPLIFSLMFLITVLGGPRGTTGPDSLIKQLKWNDARSRRGSIASVNSKPMRARHTQTRSQSRQLSWGLQTASGFSH